MAELRTEEEQLAALKDWWKQNGNSILVAIAAAVIIAVGWRAYQNNIVESKGKASAMYDQLLAASTELNVLTQTDESSGVAYLAQQLKDEFDDTEYGIYAALFLAKEAARTNDYDSALSELEWVKAQTEDTRMLDIVNARIARILSAQDKHDEALAILVANEDEFKSRFLELQGDIKLRKGDREGAVKAYEDAFKSVKDQPQIQPLLAVKLADLGINTEEL